MDDVGVVEGAAGALATSVLAGHRLSGIEQEAFACSVLALVADREALLAERDVEKSARALYAEGEVERLRVRVGVLEGALRDVSNAYACFAGCTGSLPGAPSDGSGHTPACRAARAVLAGGEAAGERNDCIEDQLLRSRRNDDGTIDLWFTDGTILTAGNVVGQGEEES